MVDTSFQGTPEWYGGATGILKELIENQRRLSAEPFYKFTGERIAPFSPLQEGAFELAQRYAQPAPEFGEARQSIQQALGSNIQPYLERGTRAPTGEDIGQFMNPYQQQVVENIGRVGSRNLLENILPGVQNRFIRSGQYGSTGQQDLTNRAIRDTQEAISQAQGQALQGGYNTALQAALGQQERQLQAGQLAGRDIERRLLGAEALQNLAGAQQTQGLRGIGALSQLGAQQQQQRQNAANAAFQEFQAVQAHPYQQQSRLSEIVRGLPVNTQVYGQNVQPPQIPQPQASPYTQLGGLGLAATGGFRGFAKGGEVKKLSHHRHYADGGQINPIQQGSNMAMDTAELKSMRDQAMRLQQPQGDPFGNALMRAGFGIAASRQPGVLAKLGEAGQMGLSEYQSGLATQDVRGLQSAKILDMIQKTREIQQQRAQQHELAKQKMAQQEKQFGMTHGLHAAQLGLQRERLGLEKQKLSSPSSQFDSEYGKMRSREEAKHDVKRSEEIREQSDKQIQGIKRIDQILDNLKEAKLGPLFDSRKYISSAAKSLDIDIPSLGDPKSMLEVKKGLIQLAMESTKDFSVRPTNFELSTAMEGLPQTFDTPEAAEKVLQSMKVFKEFGAHQNDFKERWENDFGSIRKKAPNGLTFDKAYRVYADKNIWPQLKELNKKYEVKQ